VALRDQEKRQLAEIEQGLVDDDPKFVATVRKLNAKVPRASRLLRNVLVLLATYLVGLATIVGGVLLSSAVVIVLGALITASMPVRIGWWAYRSRGKPHQPSDAPAMS
jgi:hypothetical protein